tara:strand:+ start:689 stop:1033 length:345 start_codon:yes stop_codon:yes gene_type:complete
MAPSRLDVFVALAGHLDQQDPVHDSAQDAAHDGAHEMRSPTTPSMKSFWLSKKAAEEACKLYPSMNHRDRARIVLDYRKAYQAFMLETQSGGEWTVVGEDSAKKKRRKRRKHKK